MTRCTHQAELVAEGRVVGALQCELEADHEVIEATSHAATLHWEDGEVIAEDDSEPGVLVPFDAPRCICDGGPCDRACSTLGYD